MSDIILTPVDPFLGDSFKYGFGGLASDERAKRDERNAHWQEELGLQWQDFGARNYDAALGRWMNIDPDRALKKHPVDVFSEGARRRDGNRCEDTPPTTTPLTTLCSLWILMGWRLLEVVVMLV